MVNVDHSIKTVLDVRTPVRVVYLGKPVLEPVPVLIKQLDKLTGKPILGNLKSLSLRSFQNDRAVRETLKSNGLPICIATGFCP